MGLQERRAMQTAEESWLPKRTQELEQISGASIAYEIDWSTFDGDTKAIEWLEHNGPQQISMALRGICGDALGKEAVAEGLTKVVIENVPEGDAKEVAFESGILKLKGAFAQSPRGRLDHKAIQSCLEAGL